LVGGAAAVIVMFSALAGWPFSALKPYLNRIELVFSDFCDRSATAQHRQHRRLTQHRRPLASAISTEMATDVLAIQAGPTLPCSKSAAAATCPAMLCIRRRRPQAEVFQRADKPRRGVSVFRVAGEKRSA
jgi:hypothetical protein